MATPATFEDLRAHVDDILGLDLEAEERDRFLNEAHIELCVRASWTKRRIEFGPAVADQTLYTIPDDFRRSADDALWVGSTSNVYRPGDASVARSLGGSGHYLTADGIWYIDYDDDGLRKLGVYPVPDVDASIQMLCVVAPALLEEDEDEIAVPAEFAGAITTYVKGVALGDEEDSTAERDAAMADFERQVDRLAQLTNLVESGDGPVQALVKNVHW